MATCSICLEHLKKEQKIKCTPCMHPFHTECIDLWLNENADKPFVLCPTCKNDISVLVERKNVELPVFSHFGLGFNRNYIQEPAPEVNHIDVPIVVQPRPEEHLLRRTYVSAQRRRSSSIKKMKYRKKSLNKATRHLQRLLH
jgi:hypothetical protein